MNALLLSPRRHFSFLSLPGFGKFLGCKTTGPPLGLITVAALLPGEWNFRLVDLNARDIGEDDWNWAVLVIISAMISQKESMVAVVQEAKRRGKTVVVGGPYPTSVPQDSLDAGADVVFQGEAENSIHKVLSALELPAPERVLANGEKPDMAVSPVPRFELLNLKDYISVSIQTSRGCPFNCEFCDIVNLFGRKPRYKTPDQVIAELDRLYELGWRRDIFIADDNFIANKSHARAILRKLIPWMESHGKPFDFWCQASVNLGQDIELIDMMTTANFYQVFLGIESPDEDVLKTTRKFQNVHNPLMESVENLKKNGLGVMAGFVVGFDGEEPGIGDRIIDFVKEIGIPLAILNTLRAYPNTQLWDRLKREGRLLDEECDLLCTDGYMNFVPTRPQTEILSEFNIFWKELYKPDQYLDRAYRFYGGMRPTRRATARARGDKQLPSYTTHRDPLKRKLLAIWAVLSHVWWHGVVFSCRSQFWRQVFSMRKRNPSRMTRYVIAQIFGNVMRRYRTRMLKELADRPGSAFNMSGKTKTWDQGAAAYKG